MRHAPRTSSILALTVALVASARAGDDEDDRAEPVAHPNVILILTDDQGTADLHIAGASDIATPHLDGLARTGVRFAQFYAAAPLCSPSRAGLLTGRYPHRAGMPLNASPVEGQPGLPGREITIAEMLKAAGYATGHVGKWHLGSSPDSIPSAQGFDNSYGHMGGCIDNYSHFYYWSGPNRHDLRRDGREVHAPGRFFGDLMVEEGIAFLRRNKDRPFFLYFAINAPHYPYQGDPKWLARYAGLTYPRNLYAAFLSTMDERIGRLIAELEALGLRRRTIVIVQSDHGHSTEERAHFGGGSAGIHRGAKYSLFEGGIRVPALIRWPGHLPENQVRDQVAHGCDWLPTIAELCSVPLPKVHLDGKSLAAVIRSAEAPTPHDALHWRHEGSWAVRQGDWKLLHDPLDTTRGARGERIRGEFLVNLRDDPSEKRNLAAARPDIVAHLMHLHAGLSLEP